MEILSRILKSEVKVVVSCLFMGKFIAYRIGLFNYGYNKVTFTECGKKLYTFISSISQKICLIKKNYINLKQNEVLLKAKENHLHSLVRTFKGHKQLFLVYKSANLITVQV